MKTRSKAADFLVPRSNFIYSCQVFNMYVWESEAEEQIRSLFLHCVNTFRWSQCHGFRELSKLKIVCNTATQGVGLVSIQAGWNHHWQLMFMSCLRSPLISWETVPKTIGWPLTIVEGQYSVWGLAPRKSTSSTQALLPHSTLFHYIAVWCAYSLGA